MSCEYETVKEEDGELSKILLRSCRSPFRKDYVRVGPQKVVMPKHYLQSKEAIDNFEVRPDDVWVTSFHKSGTTWTQEMVWCIANDLDFVGAEKKLDYRFPFLDLSTLFDFSEMPGREMVPGWDDSVSLVQKLESPRFIKSHLPWQLLPKQIQDGVKIPKIVYVARNAKDTCLSLYPHGAKAGSFVGDFETFAKLFIGDAMVYAPYWSHILGTWAHRDDDNVLFLRFEDMKKDLPSVIRQTAAFLGKTLSESQVQTLADHLSFSKMKDNKAVNCEDYTTHPDQAPFMRTGEAGQWKTKMSPELIQEFDAWARKHTEGTGLAL